LDEKQRSPDLTANALDRAITWVSPKIGYMRMAWRAAVRGAYKAGDISRSSEGWVPVNAKAEQVNQPQRDFIRARTKEAERNSDIVGGIIGMLERNVVATGFRLQANTGDEEINAKLEAVFEDWQKPRNSDITGMQAFWEQCKMTIRRTLVDGGIIFIKTYTGNDRFPFQLQAREVDDIDSSGQLRNGINVIVHGVEVDGNQKPVAYYLKQYSPDGWFTGKTTRVPAERVIALWRKTLPSQIREISPLAPAISRVNDTEEYLDAVSIKEKILASLSVFIKRLIPSSGVGRGLGARPDNKDYDPESGYKKKRISPGMMMELQPGDDVSAVIPTGQASNAREFASLHQRLIGSGQGLSYEATSRDMSQVNYSSARQGLLEDQRTYEDWQQWLIDHFLSEVYTEVIISAVLTGEIIIPDFWKNKAKYLRHRWIAPGWSWIDPVKEITANLKAIDSGQDNLANVCARTGYDWREILEQRAKEKAFIKELEDKYDISMTEGGNTVVKTAKPATAGSEKTTKGSGGNQ